MRRFFDSLYGRLALVLIVALGTGFAAMYVLFINHADDNRVKNFAHAISGRIQLVEEVLRSHPDFEKKPIRGISISKSPEDVKTGSSEQQEAIHRLQNALDEELGRTPEIKASAASSGGFWIQLADVPQGERWLYFPIPRHRPRIEMWMWGLWVGYFIVLVGGMTLLWGVHKPLRRLESALDQVGRIDTPSVDTSGPREIRNLAEQFNRMVARLKQYDQDRAEMLAGVAHDLRAPITRLRLQLELENSARRDAMIANLDGIDAIVNQFLTFAQGVVPEARAQRSLQVLIEEASVPYFGKGVTIVAEGQPGVQLEVMPILLGRALTNLLENAIEYGIAPITVSCERRTEEAVIRVADKGPGIPIDKMDLAKQAFTRLDTARSGKGHCGLGLAIVARIAELHQGHLVLAPNKDGGLVAEIHLPLSSHGQNSV